MNYFLYVSAGSNCIGAKYGSHKQPTETMLVMEKGGNTGGAADNYVHYVSSATEGDGGEGDCVYAAKERHKTGWNVLFLDGHVSFWSDPIPTDYNNDIFFDRKQ